MVPKGMIYITKNIAIDEREIKQEFIDQMKFDEERGFLPKGYTEAMIKQLG